MLSVHIFVNIIYALYLSRKCIIYKIKKISKDEENLSTLEIYYQTVRLLKFSKGCSPG